MQVATKVDCDTEREVSKQEGAAFAKSKGCLFVETSAKMNTAVTQVSQVAHLKCTYNCHAPWLLRCHKTAASCHSAAGTRSQHMHICLGL